MKRRCFGGSFSTAALGRQIVEKDGLPGLFSGVSVKCLEKGTENFGSNSFFEGKHMMCLHMFGNARSTLLTESQELRVFLCVRSLEEVRSRTPD